MTNDKPFLHFNYTDSEGEMVPLVFTKPSKIIVAWEIDEVMQCMQVIQQAIHDGHYAAGYLSYEAAPAFDPELHVNKGNKLPILWFGIFQAPLTKMIDSTQTFHTENWQPTVTIKNYNKNIDKIHHYIKQGHTEQVNYTIHFESQFTGDSIAFYKQLEQAQSSNYSAYLDIGDYKILSASPELFFRLKDNKIITKPMKGTIRRGKTYDEDIQNAKWLQSSEKNRNENKLIVDLMRSDLDKIAIPGTVDVHSLCAVEKYPTVFQMTSTVTAEVSEDKNFIDIFKALFPSGSITGLPKKATMDVITELETAPREVYCGTIGFITPEKEAVFNVPIRTVIIDNFDGKAQYGVGGAITVDSTKEEEYEEVLTKAALLTKKRHEFQLLETLGLCDGVYLVFEEHLKRLKQSALYFNYEVDLDIVRKELINISKKHSKKHWKVRLLVDKDGDFSIEISEFTPFTTVSFALSKEHITKNDPFLYHKTTNRTIYDVHKENHDDFFDVLLWNEDSEITEFTTGNIVVELNGILVTPPIESGLLAGTYRSKLLDEGIITEQKVMLDELKYCQKIWFINSVREWVQVYLDK